MKNKNNLHKNKINRSQSRHNSLSQIKIIAGIFIFLVISLTIFSNMQQKVAINEVTLGGVSATMNKRTGNVSTKTLVEDATSNTKSAENKDQKISSGRCKDDNCVNENQKANNNLDLIDVANQVLSVVGVEPIVNVRQLTTEKTNSNELAVRISSSTDAEKTFDEHNLDTKKSIDDAGNQVETSVRTSTNPDGSSTNQTTQITTNPDTGNSSTTITIVKTGVDGKSITASSVTSTRTRNTDGSYTVVVTDGHGNVTFDSSNSNNNSNPVMHKDARDNVALGGGAAANSTVTNTSNQNPSLGDANLPTPTSINCLNGKKLVETSKGAQCARTDVDDCDNMGIRLNGKCYMIGERTSDGYTVCDWTTGAREGVGYPFQSKNCPTKSAQTTSDPKSAVECAMQGWWNEAENGGKGRCVKVGEQIANSDLIVCKGGSTGEGYKYNRPYNSAKSDCPDYSSANLTIPVNPTDTNLGDSLNTPKTNPKDGVYTMPPAFNNPPSNQGLNTDTQTANNQGASAQTHNKQPKQCSWWVSGCSADEECAGANPFKKGECVIKNSPSVNPTDHAVLQDNDKRGFDPVEGTSKSCWFDLECGGNECVGNGFLKGGVCGGQPRVTTLPQEKWPTDPEATLSLGDSCHKMGISDNCSKCPYGMSYDQDSNILNGSQSICGYKE